MPRKILIGMFAVFVAIALASAGYQVGRRLAKAEAAADDTRQPAQASRPAQTTMLIPTSTMNTANTLRSAGPLMAWAIRVPSGAASTDPIAIPSAAGT